MTKVFSYIDANNLNTVGVEWQGVEYNFTQSWEVFKDIRLDRNAPSFPLVQLMIEMDLFHKETFDELFQTIQEYRSIDDLKIHGHRKFQAPVLRPSKIIGIGRNYAKHAEELGNPVPDELVFFAKSPSSIIASGDRIRIPKGVGRVDHEGELAVVIGKECHKIAPDQAAECIAGYTIVNDITARDMQKKDKNKGLPWFRAKSYDSFCPMGPYLVPAGAIDDPHQLTIIVQVNGEPRQQASTSEMIYSIPNIISILSSYMTLYPGDVIATGTPKGVGPLEPGDTVDVEIKGLGVLRNRVV